MSLSLHQASLIAIFVEALLFGVFTVLYIITLHTLYVKRRTSQRYNMPLLLTVTLMYALAITHLAVDMQRIWNGFVRFSDRAGGPEAYFQMLSDPLYVLKSAVYVVQTLVGDGFLIYRLVTVWDHDKRIVVPAVICYTASIAVAIGTLQAFSQSNAGMVVFMMQMKQWIVSFYSLTLFQNLVCTSLIAARIWWMSRSGKSVIGTHNLICVMAIIVESGTIYSLTLITLLSVYLSTSYAQYIPLDATTQIIGIVFSLIIVRMGLGLTDNLANSTNRTALSVASGSAETVLIPNSSSTSQLNGHLHHHHSHHYPQSHPQYANGHGHGHGNTNPYNHRLAPHQAGYMQSKSTPDIPLTVSITREVKMEEGRCASNPVTPRRRDRRSSRHHPHGHNGVTPLTLNLSSKGGDSVVELTRETGEHRMTFVSSRTEVDGSSCASASATPSPCTTKSYALSVDEEEMVVTPKREVSGFAP